MIKEAKLEQLTNQKYKGIKMTSVSVKMNFNLSI